jgi:hypothetical protein
MTFERDIPILPRPIHDVARTVRPATAGRSGRRRDIVRHLLTVAVLLTMGVITELHAQTRTGGAAENGADRDANAVLTAERNRFTAMIKNDIVALDRLLAPELVYTHGDARRIGKAAFLADFESGAFRYARIEPSEMNVSLHGEVAIVTGTAAMSIVSNGTPADIRIRYTNVHVRRNGAWQMIAWQATRLSQP